MSNSSFFDRLKQNPRPVVVDFWAPWCGPCRVIEPVVKKLGAEYQDQVDVWKVNADEQPELLRLLRIYGIPTLIAFHQGREVSRRTGATSQQVLAGLFQAALSGDKPVPAGPASLDRILRLVAGTTLLVLAFTNSFSGWYLPLAVLGAVVAFTAVYDRCPIYRAVSGRIKEWLKKEHHPASGS
jgi:thioredoxin 1